MIPTTYPSTNGKMVVYKLSSISGKTRWSDYIPVVTQLTEGEKNSYNGTINVSVLSSITGKTAWIDYVPVYEDASATKPWLCSSDGYIPVYA